ncbi:MAG: mechanosensitive ion channel family protein [archaeon]
MAFPDLKQIFIDSFGKIILIISIFVITALIARIVGFVLKRFFKRSSKILNVDPTKYTFIRYLISAAIYLIGISIAISMIPSLRSLAVSLLAGAGILVIVIGFASQQAFSNIISGIFIVIFKPFRIGDRLKIGTDLRGIVEDITLRHTVIRDFENKRIIIPNSVINNEILENSTIGDEKICKWVEFGISYDSDVDKAKKIMMEEALKHPKHIDNRTKEEQENKDPIVRVRIVGFGDSSVNLRAYVWAKNPPDAWMIGCDLNENIKKRFDKEGVEIPFPYRTIVFKDNKSSKKKSISRK